jgi:nucleoside-diphosphate-sugar epimerase
VYGDPTVHPQTEEYRGNVNPIGPRACYDEGKRCAETLFFDYFRQQRVRIKVVRIFNTYGPHMHPNDGRVVSNFIVQALRGEDITIYGDGSQTRAFCYVDDLIEGFVRMMGTGDDVTGPINIGNPVEIPVRELAERVIARCSVAPTLPARAPCSAGSRKWTCNRGWSAQSRILTDCSDRKIPRQSPRRRDNSRHATPGAAPSGAPAADPNRSCVRGICRAGGAPRARRRPPGPASR